MLTPDELVFTFGGSYICANVCENRSRNAIVRVPTEVYTDTLTDTNRFYSLTYAICYSYGADNNGFKCEKMTVWLMRMSAKVL